MIYKHIYTNEPIKASEVAILPQYEYYTDTELKLLKDYKYAVVDTSYNNVITGYCVELKDYNRFIDNNTLI